MAAIMHGHPLAKSIKEKVKEDVGKLNETRIDVGLGLLIAGDVPASRQYFLAIIKACKRVGITTYTYTLPEDTSANSILHIVHKINNDVILDFLILVYNIITKSKIS